MSNSTEEEDSPSIITITTNSTVDDDDPQPSPSFTNNTVDDSNSPPSATATALTATTQSINYNINIQSCPGYEELGLHGYTTLSAIQTDLTNYYKSVHTNKSSAAIISADEASLSSQLLANSTIDTTQPFNNNSTQTQSTTTAANSTVSSTTNNTNNNTSLSSTSPTVQPICPPGFICPTPPPTPTPTPTTMAPVGTIITGSPSDSSSSSSVLLDTSTINNNNNNEIEIENNNGLLPNEDNDGLVPPPADAGMDEVGSSSSGGMPAEDNSMEEDDNNNINSSMSGGEESMTTTTTTMEGGGEGSSSSSSSTSMTTTLEDGQESSSMPSELVSEGDIMGTQEFDFDDNGLVDEVAPGTVVVANSDSGNTLDVFMNDNNNRQLLRGGGGGGRMLQEVDNDTTTTMVSTTSEGGGGEGIEANTQDSTIVSEENGLQDEVSAAGGTITTSTSTSSEASSSSNEGEMAAGSDEEGTPPPPPNTDDNSSPEAVDDSSAVLAEPGHDSSVVSGGDDVTADSAAGSAPTTTVGQDEGDSVNNEGVSTTSTSTAIEEEEESSAAAATATAMATSNTIQTNEEAEEKEVVPTISFPICPNSNLYYDNDDDDANTAPLLTIESPSKYNPIDIYCITDSMDVNNTRSCSISGGNVHILIENTNDDDDGDDAAVGDEHPITIHGITFTGAKISSISMLNPRGLITLHDCGWTANNIDNADNSGSDGAASGSSSNTTMKSSATMGGATIQINGMHTVTPTPSPSIIPQSNVSSSLDPIDLPNFDPVDDQEALDSGNSDMMMVAEQPQMPRATVKIEGSSFSKNKGRSTIDVLSSASHSTIITTNLIEHSIHLSIKDTSFTSQAVTSSIITNDGGQLVIERADFVTNNASAFGIINSRNNGTVALTDTTFDDNYIMQDNISGGGSNNDKMGVVVLDNGSALKMNVNNCGGSNNALVVEEEGSRFTSFDEYGAMGGGNSGGSGGGGTAAAATSTNDAPQAEEEEGNGEDTDESLSSSTSEEAQYDMWPNADASTGETTDATIRRRKKRRLQEQGCDGIYAAGVCNAFVPCDDAQVVTIPTQESEIVSCYSDWDKLVMGVRDRPLGVRDFIICPGSVLTVVDSSSSPSLANTNPVVIDSDYITIQCGTTKEPSNDCIISGGHSHFHIVGGSSGLAIARLSMRGATRASIMAFGTSEATLNLRDCEWTKNKGASAILLHDNDALPIPGLENSESSLDIKTVVASAQSASVASSAMALQVVDCTFTDNELEYGAIANLGGTLSVSQSRFSDNSGLGGDIVVTNGGDCNVQSSCFMGSSSVAPGIIFIENGSTMGGKNNFGADSNTAGTYTDGEAKSASCTYVFQEAKGSKCLMEGADSCTGSCMAFPANVCPLDVVTGDAIPSPAPNIVILVPAISRSEGSGGSSKIIPIIVAAIVGAFVVFGFFGIIMRRRKKGVEPAARGCCSRLCCCCKRGKRGSTADDEDIEQFHDNDYD